MMKKLEAAEQATIENSKDLLDNRIAGLPIWIRWLRAYDNPGGGGAFGKSRIYCTVQLIGVTAKRLKVKDHDGVHFVDPKTCLVASRKDRIEKGEGK